jgi:hypothetical protein
LTGGVEIRKGRDKLDYRPKLPANYHVDDGPWTGRARSGKEVRDPQWECLRRTRISIPPPRPSAPGRVGCTLRLL